MSPSRAFAPGSVVFVGAGPGDPDLLTLRGKAAIEQADVVIYADSLVHPGVAALARRDAEVLGSATLTLEQLSERMIQAAREGKLVARVQSGDPSLYGAVHEQMVRLAEAGVPFEVVPGVSAVFAAAAALRAELTVPGVAQSVILTRLPSRTPMPERERLRDLARHGGTLVLFLSVGLVERAARELIAGGFDADTPAAVVYRVTWEDEQIIRGTLGSIASQTRAAGFKRQALILVGEALAPVETAGGVKRRSRLYHPRHTHLFRTRRGRATEAPG